MRQVDRRHCSHCSLLTKYMIANDEVMQNLPTIDRNDCSQMKLSNGEIGRINRNATPAPNITAAK